jgi:hypothetical protein
MANGNDAPSVDDLMAQTRALKAPPQQQGPSYDELLAQTRAVVPPPATKPAQPSAGDMFASGTSGEADIPPWMMKPGSIPSLDDIRSKIQQGETSALNALRPGPDASWLEQAGRTAAAVGVHGLSGLAQFPVNALIGLTEHGPQIDPKTGSLAVPGATWNPQTGTFGITPEAASVVPFVAGLGGRDIQFSGSNPLQFVPPGTFDRTAQLSPEFTSSPMAAELAARLRGDTAAGGARLGAGETPAVPATPTGVPVTPTATPPTTGAAPQPAGAQATPPGAAQLTPAEVAAYRATAEGNKLLENQRVGEPDRAAYIPDVTPNSVEQEQTVTAARELKSLGVTSPEASNEAKLAAQANNDARTSYWNDTTRSPVDIQKAEADRAQQAEADLKATWANKTDADASAVLDVGNQIKASPDGRRPAVRNAIDSVTSELTGADGNLITDPEQLYGVRKHIDDLLSKEGQRETPLAARATASLQAIKDQLDTTIEAAAPGFKQYLKNFSDASKPIDEMQVLQGASPNLFKGPNSTLRYSDVQRFMKNVVDMRNTQGVNPYKSISDDTMQRLWNLRDDLRRSASAQELARAPGSDTTPNIIDAMKQYAKMGGATAVDVAASHIFGPVAGPMIARGMRAAAAPIISQRTAGRQMGRMQEMLYPSNPLQPPPPP